MAVCLEMKKLRKVYKKGEIDVEALRGIDLVIEKGEFVSIMGPSGSGKTTLLNIVGCLDVPTSGEVIYNETPLHNLKENELSDYRKNNIGFIFQSYNLIPVLTVLENVELPMVIDKSLSVEERTERAMKLIERVGLKGMENRYPRELSGGQEQRVAIARALVKNPLVVLADEPTANLDSVTAEEIIEIMRQMNETEGTTFVFSTHDPRVEKHARRIIFLQDGQIARDERR
ncbi:ABC transporter ATP-binding protein [Thermospira aquatica]|uniref:ABC transporter ATP-binding protein n=1 Tax=Thermospira aquatica TaxID=2828656 RepID=A0AAX3BCB0_9SPIR|nr:ABC transporter ATP-binding protein [Thermospira aquatica]URA09890.1 ABC transporter ATP-binding protein [Thermospira aquatica]